MSHVCVCFGRSMMVKIAVVALLASITMMTSLNGVMSMTSVAPSSCCWAQKNQQYRWNITSTASNTKEYMAIEYGYEQWDTETGW
jgi:hypothetical protein